MPDEDKTFRGSFVLDLRIWWRQAHTLYNTNMKKFACKKVPEDVSWGHFFAFEKTFFSEFPYKIFLIALHEIIGLQNFSLSFCKS